MNKTVASRNTEAKKLRNKTNVIDYSKVFIHEGKHVFEYMEEQSRKSYRFWNEIEQLDSCRG